MDGDDMDKLPLKTLLTKWLVSQGTSTILLLLILAGMWRIADHAMNTAIPEHLKQIQSGYERIEEGHSKEVDQLRSSFDRAMDRIDRMGRNDQSSIGPSPPSLVKRKNGASGEPSNIP